MVVDVVTREDLQAFRIQLVNDFKQILQSSQPKSQKQWLKNCEVKRLLNISSNTIQRLRVAGKLKSSKVGGVYYYSYEDIELLLQSGFEKEVLCKLAS